MLRLPVPEFPTVKSPATDQSVLESVTKIFPTEPEPSPIVPLPDVARVWLNSIVKFAPGALLASSPTVRPFE